MDAAIRTIAEDDDTLTIEGLGIPFGGPFPGNSDSYGTRATKKTNFAWDLFPDPADKLLRWIWRMPVPVEDREQLVADIRARRRAAQEPPRRESACLPR